MFGVRSTPTSEFYYLQENLTELNPASHNPTHQLIARRNEKWAANVFQIVSWNRRTPSTPIYTMYAKTDALRKRWISAFNLAIENNSPPGYKDNGHIFEMHTFREPSECNVCQRLLKGSFLQVRWGFPHGLCTCVVGRSAGYGTQSYVRVSSGYNVLYCVFLWYIYFNLLHIQVCTSHYYM